LAAYTTRQGRAHRVLPKRVVVALGESGIYDKTAPGASCKLTPEQLRQLRTDLVAGPDRCVFESSLWTARLLIVHVGKKFGVKYASSSMYDLLHRMLLITQARAKTPKGSLRIQTKCV